jgi:ATP-dependent RNA helicase RhlE
VLDEADKMMDMGFAPQIHEILEKIPRKRQNLLFSATFPPKVEAMAQELLDFPIRIEVTPQSTAASTVAQYFYKTPNLKTKISLLEHLLQGEDFTRVIVFARTRQTADNVFKFLDRKYPNQVRCNSCKQGSKLTD